MPLDKSLPTPNNPNASGVTFSGSVELPCPASTAWDILKDFTKYGEWNSFTPEVTFPDGALPGSVGTVKYRLKPDDSDGSISVKLLSLDDASRTIIWQRLGTPGFMLLPERVQRIEIIDDTRCRYVSYETMSGVLAPVVNWTVGNQLDAANERVGEDMRKYIAKTAG